MSPLPVLLPPLLLLSAVASSATEPRPPNANSYHRLSCDYPFKLSRDCSIWHGPQRDVIFAGHKLSIAADDTGRTILVARVQRLPESGSGLAFSFSLGSGKSRALTRAIMQVARQLAAAGHELRDMTPCNQGNRTTAYFLHFTSDVHAYLKRYTVLPAPLDTGLLRP